MDDDVVQGGLPLRLRFRPCVQLQIPGFERHDWGKAGAPVAYHFRPIDCRAWYRDMVAILEQHVGSGVHLPVLRMFDGEYALAVGRPADRLPWRKLSLRQIGQRLHRYLTGTAHRSGSAHYGWEQYTRDELSAARVRYAECVRQVAREGFLALGLHNRLISEQYIPEILDWFDANAIQLRPRNYFHFYFVYALIHGPDCRRLLEGRRILVVTSLTDGKRRGIDAGLGAVGAADVQFLPISPDKAMLEHIDLTAVDSQPDIVLIGAGVGAASVLCQLQPLRAVCLDVGFCLSTLADPTLKWVRPFCVPDDEYDATMVKWLPSRSGF